MGNTYFYKLSVVFFGCAILFLFGVRIISFNNNVLNIDELEWLYCLQRSQIDPRPFLGFETHTSGPVAIYFLSLINLFVDQPTTIHLRLFSFFILILPALAIFFWRNNKNPDYAGLAFFVVMLSINYVPFELKQDDFFCYNTEFQILIFTALLFQLLSFKPRVFSVIGFSLLLVLFLFVKIQVAFLFLFFAGAMLVRLIINREYLLITFYLLSFIVLFSSIAGYLWLSDSLSEAFYVYVEKNIMYQANLSGEQINWALVIKNMLSIYRHQFFYPSLILGISGFIVLTHYFKRINSIWFNPIFLESSFFLSGCLLIVSFATIVASKNNFGHYFIISFYPMALFFSELFQIITEKIWMSNARKIYLTGIFLATLLGANFIYFWKSVQYFLAPINQQAKLELGDPKGFRLQPELKIWLVKHTPTSDRTILFLGWYNAEMIYYELGKSFEPVYRSANTFWYFSTYASHNQYFFNHEEANLLDDLNRKPPYYVVDSENELNKMSNTRFTKFLDLNYFVVFQSPFYKVYQRKV